MARAFDTSRPGKGFVKALALLRTAIRGGLVADDVNVQSGASTVVLDPTPYESRVRSSGAATQQVLQIPAGTKVGQRHLVTFVTEVAGGDSLRINAGAGVSLQQAGIQGDAAAAAVTNVDLAAVNDRCLFEYSAPNTWNIIYTNGTLS